MFDVGDQTGVRVLKEKRSKTMLISLLQDFSEPK